MNTTLTNDQITAGAAVLDLDMLEALACAATRGPWRRSERPSGPFWHISSEYTIGGERCKQGRQAIGSVHAASKRDAPKYAAMFQANADFVAAANPATVLELINLARRAPSPQVAEKVELPQSQQEWEDRYKTGVQPWSFRVPSSSPLQDVCSAMQAELNELRPLVAASRRAAGGDDPVAWIRKTDIRELTDSEPETEGWTPLYATPALPGAGKAAPAAARNYRDEEFLTAARVALVSLAHAAEKHGIYQTDYDRFAAAVEKFAAQPAEGAGQAKEALQAANALLFDMIGKPEWDLPCAAKHLMSYAAHTERTAAPEQPEGWWQGGA